METTLQGIYSEDVFLNEILVIGKNQDEHDKRSTFVLERLNGAGVVLQLFKCHFNQNKTKYLRFVISGQGLQQRKKK